MMGERLRTLRQRVGLSRADLARLAGVSETAVWRLERGERGGSWELVARIARALAAEAGRPVGEVLAELVGEEAVQREAAPRRIFLTVREAAYVLGLPLWRVKEAVRRGEMRPRPRPGPRGAVMIPVEEVERYARSLMQEAVHG